MLLKLTSGSCKAIVWRAFIFLMLSIPPTRKRLTTTASTICYIIPTSYHAFCSESSSKRASSIQVPGRTNLTFIFPTLFREVCQTLQLSLALLKFMMLVAKLCCTMFFQSLVSLSLYIYIYMCVCVCVCVCAREWEEGCEFDLLVVCQTYGQFHQHFRAQFSYKFFAKAKA
jgi:hypothetical protein